MKKFITVFLIILGLCLKADAIEVVYPKTNPVKINSPSTFFVGSASPNSTLKINDIEVKTAPNGGFAQSVRLEFGENKFKLVSGEEQVDFVIERPLNLGATQKVQETNEFPMLSVIVKKDNAPLRMTPIDGGINRMVHLPSNIPLFIKAERGNFYRVYLNSKVSGWILKSDVEQVPSNISTTQLKNIKQKEDQDYCIYEFELESISPYILTEENGLKLEIFNLSNQTDNTYCLNIPAKKLLGYQAFFEENKLILKVRKEPEIKKNRPLKNITVAIDAGHGGCEKGAIGCCGEEEKNINLAIAKNLQQDLIKRGAKVIMTRDGDYKISLQDRVDIAKKNDATILISIHANALPDNKDPLKNRGTSVYYYYPQAKPLAESILESMTQQLGTQNDKVRQGSLALVRNTSSVSVLIEVAYMINPDDYLLLTDTNFQINCAKAIADGIENYLNK